MTTWSKPVYSSNVSEVGYDTNTNELMITWARGKNRKSIYSGVPQELAEQLANAPSVGTMLNSEIKPFFPHRYA